MSVVYLNFVFKKGSELKSYPFTCQIELCSFLQDRLGLDLVTKLGFSWFHSEGYNLVAVKSCVF